MSPRARSQSECGRYQPPLPLHAHRERLRRASRTASPLCRRASRRRSDRPPARWRPETQRQYRGHLPGIRGRPEKIPPPPVVQRRGNARRGRSAPGANRRTRSGRIRRRGSVAIHARRRNRYRSHRNRNRRARKAPRRSRSPAASEIRAHLARAPRPHDERRRRTRHQPHPHGRPPGRTGQTGRGLEFLEEPPLVPGSHAPQMDTFRPNFLGMPAITSNDLLEFSELEMDRYDDVNILSRSLTEISADVNVVLTQLEGFMGRVDSDIDEFTKLAHHLQDEITAARMVPIGNLYTRLSRTVRDAANATGKPIELSLEGSNTELDNNIIQHVSDPLIHLVRNAVAHGVEDRRTRQRSGKSEKGLVSVRAYHRGNHIFIEVEDDGRGIDYDGARRRVVEMGAMSSVAAAELTERELREFLFRPGFTTAAAMTELAGRGVGLDVVRANVHALNGEIEVRSEPGHGATFTVKVPLTLIISQALFVRCGTSVFALPLAVVEEIRRLKPGEIEDVGGKLLTRVRDVVTEVVRLDVQLALPPLEPLNGYFHMVIVKVAGKQVGVVVEEVLGKDEIVIKNLGDYLRGVKLFPGTTIAPDGSLILLIDLNRLASADTAERNALPASSPAARVFAPGAEAVAAGSIPAGAVDSIENDRVVVVADDSISVRKFVGRMLEKAGYRVKLASDGLEASELVAQIGCHLVVTDLEMPRMNGYELMAHLRQNPVTRKIPVLVVTSRAGAKHRDRAIKEGAAAFLTKPVQEDQLVATVDELIGAEKPDTRRKLNVPVRQDSND